MAPYLDTVQDNRISGLLRELAEAIAEEGSALTLSRIAVSLQSLSHAARCESHAREQDTREIERARNTRKPRPQRRLA